MFERCVISDIGQSLVTDFKLRGQFERCVISDIGQSVLYVLVGFK